MAEDERKTLTEEERKEIDEQIADAKRQMWVAATEKAKNKKSIFKSWWFWVLVAALFVGQLMNPPPKKIIFPTYLDCMNHYSIDRDRWIDDHMDIHPLDRVRLWNREQREMSERCLREMEAPRKETP